jgi:hypothetical protein
MEFPDKIKAEVRKRSASRCCICREPGIIEAHHINNELSEEDGLQDIENAAPLCPGCHAKYGDAPINRKMIRENRDNLYEWIKQRYGGIDGHDLVVWFDDNIERIEKLVFIAKAKRQEGDMVKAIESVIEVDHTAGNVSGALLSSSYDVEYKDKGPFRCAKCGYYQNYWFSSVPCG